MHNDAHETTEALQPHSWPKILVLPSKSCQCKHLTLSTSQRHSSLVIDEFKLLEHLTVQSSGYFQGFAELGDFMPANQKNELCDHGLVVIFNHWKVRVHR